MGGLVCEHLDHKINVVYLKRIAGNLRRANRAVWYLIVVVQQP
jgi:hypothetical protein